MPHRNPEDFRPLLKPSAVRERAQEMLRLALAALAPSTPLVLTGFAITGIGLANIVPILFSAAGQHGGSNPGAAIAAVSFLGYGGMLMAPSVIGVTAEEIGFPAILLALAGRLLAVGALAPVVGGSGERAAHRGLKVQQDS